MLYDGAEHISIASLEGMRDRTITINALSKTYSVTGWRVGWAIAPPEVTSPFARCTIFLPSARPRRCRQAGALALDFPRSYYDTLAQRLRRASRERMLGILTAALVPLLQAAGAYYIMTDISAFGFPGRCRLRETSRQGNRRRRRPRIELLSQSRRRPHAAPLHILQNGENVPGRRRAPRETEAARGAGEVIGARRSDPR